MPDRVLRTSQLADPSIIVLIAEALELSGSRLVELVWECSSKRSRNGAAIRLPGIFFDIGIPVQSLACCPSHWHGAVLASLLDLSSSWRERSAYKPAAATMLSAATLLSATSGSSF